MFGDCLKSREIKNKGMAMGNKKVGDDKRPIDRRMDGMA